MAGFVFKPYGEGFNKNPTKIHAEISHQHDYIREKGGAAFYPRAVFELSTLNVIHDLMFNERFAAGDQTEMFLRGKVRELIDSLNPLFDIFPLAVHLPRYRKQLAAVPAQRDAWNQFNAEKIAQCKNRQGAEDNNFVAQFIQKAGSEYDEKELITILRDFVTGGTETTSTQLCWAVILVGNHQVIQHRLQKELDASCQRTVCRRWTTRRECHIWKRPFSRSCVSGLLFRWAFCT